MATKLSIFLAFPVAVLLAATAVFSADDAPIPAEKSQLATWFNENVKPLADRKSTLDPALVAAEEGAKVVKVMKDGTGDFKTITEAINSIPAENTKRVIVYIGAGTYEEKIKIDRNKPFVTLFGEPGNNPNLTFAGTAKQYGTVDSATLIAESNYFVAANLIISNSAPMPDGRAEGAQAVAARISGDFTALYSCTLLGFQDTLCDDSGNHLFKDCTIQGTVDFIFGSGKSLFLDTKLIVVGEEGGVITAQARKNEGEDIGYTFVHCDISGTANGTWLGRAWMPHAKVVFAYTSMSKIVNPLGWNENNHPNNAQTVFFGEYKNTGDSGS
ncbi:pectinesterase family protein, partial [Pasteurella multocida]|uniref:pectinesterase family protein n=1 Tax=Pasteurella multocida TaxID=747 RepID=UPI001F0FB55D